MCIAIDILEEEIEKVKNKESETERPLMEFLTLKNRRINFDQEEQRQILGSDGVGKAQASSPAFLSNCDHGHLDTSRVISQNDRKKVDTRVYFESFREFDQINSAYIYDLISSHANLIVVKQREKRR